MERIEINSSVRNKYDNVYLGKVIDKTITTDEIKEMFCNSLGGYAVIYQDGTFKCTAYTD
jgi:hypothetical protein